MPTILCTSAAGGTRPCLNVHLTSCAAQLGARGIDRKNTLNTMWTESEQSRIIQFCRYDGARPRYHPPGVLARRTHRVIITSCWRFQSHFSDVSLLFDHIL